METKANDTQVAGNHYRAMGDKLQHWDLVAMFEWDYFQAQVIKYLMRWKNKHETPFKRIEDLKKARHFLDKYIELQEAAAKVRDEVVSRGEKYSSALLNSNGTGHP
jgi:aspartokinase